MDPEPHIRKCLLDPASPAPQRATFEVRRDARVRIEALRTLERLAPRAERRVGEHCHRGRVSRRRDLGEGAGEDDSRPRPVQPRGRAPTRPMHAHGVDARRRSGRRASRSPGARARPRLRRRQAARSPVARTDTRAEAAAACRRRRAPPRPPRRRRLDTHRLPAPAAPRARRGRRRGRARRGSRPRRSFGVRRVQRDDASCEEPHAHVPEARRLDHLRELRRTGETADAGREVRVRRTTWKQLA